MEVFGAVVGTVFVWFAFCGGLGLGHEKKRYQLSRRHGAGLVRHLMGSFRGGQITAAEAADELGVSVRWFRKLYAQYLRACAEGRAAEWEPGTSGGNRRRAVPEEVSALWRRLLSTKPPAPYNFAASEAFRRFGYTADRATVRRWAQANGLAHPKAKKRERAAVRRWQCQDVGALWQLDCSPHGWLGDPHSKSHMLNMVDDCSRVLTGTRLYPRECLLAYLDFLPRAFEAYGVPLALYVDYHSIFFTHIPENLTYLAETLRYVDVSLIYAPTAQAKGKIERHHQFWQNRLPCFCLAEDIRDLDTANEQIDQLRDHHNRHELHREIKRTPLQAWHEAIKAGRTKLRPWKRDPWWPYIWSVRSKVHVASAGTDPLEGRRVKITQLYRRSAIHCQHPDGSVTYLAEPPGSGGRPIVLYRYESLPKRYHV